MNPQAAIRRLQCNRLRLPLCIAAGVLSIQAARAFQAPDPEVAFRIIVASTPERAARIAERLQAGEDFSVLARAESIDPSGPQGGLIGPIRLSELRAELQAALRDLLPGRFRGVLTMPTGYAIVQRLQPDAAVSARGAELLALKAVGGVKPTISVDGVVEVQTALINLQKPERWNEDPGLICELRQQGIISVERELSRVLGSGAAGAGADFTPLELIEGHVSLAQLRAFAGDLDGAVRNYEQARRLAAQHQPASVSDHDQATAIACIAADQASMAIHSRAIAVGSDERARRPLAAPERMQLFLVASEPRGLVQQGYSH